MNDLRENVYILGQYADWGNLLIQVASPYQMYCEALKSNHNIPISFEDWNKAEKDGSYHGLYTSAKNTIFICNGITNEEKFKQVLRHELTHAFLNYVMPVGMGHDEETICEIFSKHYDEYTKFINDITKYCLGNYRKEMKHCD